MTLTATPATRRPAAPAPILGGDAWVMPREPSPHPWLTVSAPQIRITDQRAARAAQR